jgi:hypothetical protein
VRLVPLSERQLAAFADKHAWQIPFDTSPRHLAGPGDARHVTHGLAAAGWSPTSDPLSAEIGLRSPDHRYRLQFDPQSATSAWWRLRAEPTGTEHGWYAEFGELVPAEVLAGLTDALVAPAPAEPTNPLPVLEAAGWLIDGRGAAVSDPPGCRVERRPEKGDRTVPWREPDRASWHIEVRDHPGPSAAGPRIWHAWFDGNTPEHLVTAFITALADPHRCNAPCSTAPPTTASCNGPARSPRSRPSTRTPAVSTPSARKHAPPADSGRSLRRPRH